MCRTTVAYAVVLSAVVASIPHLALAADTCEEAWDAIKLEDHHWSECEGTWLCVGIPITFTTAPPLYRQHPGTWNKSEPVDRDCHLHTDCTFSDDEEEDFICQWTMQMYDWEMGEWVEKGPPGGNCNCTGANWVTENFEPRYQCNTGGEYRAKFFIKDTPEDGPYGDDTDKTMYSSSVVLWAPDPVNWHPAENCWCNVGPKGSLYIAHFWGAECCGDVGHLDLVTVREKVTFEATWTTGGRHYMAHGGANSWTNTPPDPTYDGCSGTTGIWQDLHEFPVVGSPIEPSFCQANQVHQWATGWPTAPDPDNDSACWQPLCSHICKRYIEDDDTRWRYRTIVTKPGGGWWECFDYEQKQQ